MDTFGCQMNVADTDRMELLLFHSGYTRTQTAENADLIVVNTCSIREKAEHKLFSLMGGFRPLKETNPDLILGLAGCMAQQDGEKLLKRMPYVDFIMGPDRIEELPFALEELHTARKPIVWTGFDQHKNYSIPALADKTEKYPGASAFINIIKGCDKFCSFCVVPHTRGREKSREPQEIFAEATDLVRRGAKEIVLLGQNVNAYGKRGLDNPVEFHQLLYDLSTIPDLQRLRFTTSHPKDFTPKLIQAYRDIDILMNHLHLPVQSGNNRVLEEMRRSHTIEEYTRLIDQLRQAVPDIALTTDIIVGFPSETDREFEDTLRLMEKIRFSNSFIFSYSPRPGTPAAEWPDTVSEELKKSRLHQTMALQNSLTQTEGSNFSGKTVDVLVEGKTSRPGTDFWGRNPQYWVTKFRSNGKNLKEGDIAQVAVNEIRGCTLMGDAVA